MPIPLTVPVREIPDSAPGRRIGAEAGNVSVRNRQGETTAMGLDDFVAKVTEEIKTRA